eukprot:jgi/Astpho2/6706/e_gw1.00102.62.1_t
MLRAFDLTSSFGPCTGMSRRERWQRADKLGLQPPREVLHILDALQDDDAQLQCLWYGRI